MRSVFSAAPLASATATAIAITFALVACKTEPPVQKETTPKAPQAIPSDFVVNPMFQGLDTAKPAAGGAAGASDEAPGGAAAADGPAPTKILEPGAEPRAKLRYAFKPGKTLQIVATTRVTAEAQQGAPVQPPLRFTIALTPQPGGAKDTTFALTLAKVEIVAASDAEKKAAARSAAGLAALAGLAGTFDVSPLGELKNLQFKAERVPQGAEEILQMVEQALEITIVTFPEEAVGKGAKWQQTAAAPAGGPGEAAGGGITVTTTLTDVGPTGGVASVATQRALPPQPLGPRAPKGATLTETTNGTYVVDYAFDRLAGKASGSTALVRTLTDPTSKPPRTESQTIKLEQTIVPAK